MNKSFLALVAALVVGGAFVAPTAQAGRHCTVPGTVYVAQVDACILHVTDPATVQREVPDMADDPNCRGKPPGFRYDKLVPPQHGYPAGVAHMVCGVRPN